MVCASTFNLRSWWWLQSEILLKQQPSNWVSVQKHSDNPQTNVSALLLVPFPPKEVKLLAATFLGLFSTTLFLGELLHSGFVLETPFLFLPLLYGDEQVHPN